MTKDNISELENLQVEISQVETEKEKKSLTTEENIQKLWNDFKSCHTCVVVISEEVGNIRHI